MLSDVKFLQIVPLLLGYIFTIFFAVYHIIFLLNKNNYEGPILTLFISILFFSSIVHKFKNKRHVINELFRLCHSIAGVLIYCLSVTMVINNTHI